MSTDLPAPQFRSAWRLAHTYGHHWAWAVLCEVFPGEHPAYDGDRLRPQPELEAGVCSRLWSVESICAASEAHSPAITSAIMAPQAAEHVDGGLILSHTTLTGRMSWMVWPQGTVDFDLRRPGPAGPMLAMEGAVGPHEIFARGVRNRWHLRHLRALEEAMLAAAGPEGELGVRDTLASIWKARHIVEEVESAALSVVVP